MPAAQVVTGGASRTDTYVDTKRKDDVRQANMLAAKAVADAVRTSLGPRGMDKMLTTSSGEVIITNDGATILNKVRAASPIPLVALLVLVRCRASPDGGLRHFPTALQLEVTQPAAKMLVELSKSQDIVAGDGTTTVVVLAGALLKQCLGLLAKGVHPTVISEALHKASEKAVEVLTAMAVPVELSDRGALVKSASTSLNSKVRGGTRSGRGYWARSFSWSPGSHTCCAGCVTALRQVVSQYSSLLAPMAVDCVLSLVDPEQPADPVDLRNIKVIKKLGGTVSFSQEAAVPLHSSLPSGLLTRSHLPCQIDDTEIVRGLVFDQKASHAAGGPTRIENAKIGLIQFQVSPPKTDMEQNVVISDYAQVCHPALVGGTPQMDRILKEERSYILGMVKKIRAAGCNVLLVQKSILRDAVTDLSLHYLAKAKILVVKDVEREDIEFITRTLGCLPIANIEHFRVEKLGSADLVEEVTMGESKVVRVTGIESQGRTMTVVVRGSNQLVLDEAERSLHDALCVVRCLVTKRFLIAGGGAPEIEVSWQLGAWAKTLQGMESYCVRAFAEAMEVVPYTLAENAGLNPIAIVTELRNHHAMGEVNTGINVRKGVVTNILEENVVQPLLVSTSAVSLATECVRMVLKIDDIVITR
eukprot:SM000008S22273  [mRNA]  locus=s8:816314:819159:+ [translate_table: standard]